MAASREIRTKISSIKNTQKTTRAMEMVAASKMRKAQERMQRSKPYASKIRQVIRHLATSHAEYRHVYMQERDVSRVGYIIVSTDRGLCGGLNVNMFKSVVQHMQAYAKQGIHNDVCVLGRKGQAFFNRINANLLGVATHLPDAVTIQDLLGVVSIMIDAFVEKKLDRVYICANEFVTTMNQQPYARQLLPLPAAKEAEYKRYWDYIYEPDSRVLLEELLKRYIEVQVYQAVVENFACQQAATMVAMKSASDNAGDLINDFQLAYNKARQAAITQEISEIVSGAQAV
jgi:F-type H+-transporting ATPase subunit gamma